MKNIKALVSDAVAALFKVLDADSEKEQAVRRLGIASELASKGEAEKKKAKADLTKLGILTGGAQDGIIFDSARYQITAATSAASSRLDPDLLNAALDAEKLSAAAKRRILEASSKETKGAVRLTVISK
jgi:hypothetical protein